MGGNGNETNGFTGQGKIGRPTGFQMQDCTVLWKQSNNAIQWYQSTAYNSHTAIDVVDYGGQSVTGRNSYTYCWAGLSGDYWLSGYKDSYPISWGIPMQIFKVTKGNVAQGGGSENKHTFTPSYEVYSYLSDVYSAIFPLWENTSDQYPKKIVYVSRVNMSGKVIVSDLPDSADWAT